MFDIAGEYLMADPKETEPSQAQAEVPVKEQTSEIKKGRQSRRKQPDSRACCADQIRQVGQTGVFT